MTWRRHRIWGRLRGLPDGKRLLWLVVATAFLMQSYVAQTHIHVIAVGGGSVSSAIDLDSVIKVAKTDQRLPDDGKQQNSDDPAKCPLCQAVGHAGQYVWPAALVLVVPMQVVRAVPVAAALLLRPVPESHNWQGRAPPRL